MTGPMRLTAADPGTPATGPVPGTGSGVRPGGPMVAPTWPALTITVPAPLDCGHVVGDLCDDDCAYWRMVATGELPSPEAYLVDGVHHLPPHLPGLAPLVDPALRRAA